MKEETIIQILNSLTTVGEKSLDDLIEYYGHHIIEANKSIKDIVNTDTAVINCGAYGKGRIYNLEMSVENESNS